VTAIARLPLRTRSLAGQGFRVTTALGTRSPLRSDMTDRQDLLWAASAVRRPQQKIGPVRASEFWSRW